MSGEKERIDSALVRRGLASSREKAQAMIMAGEVYIGQRKAVKSSETVCAADQLILKSCGEKYVSRGAYKLDKALRSFQANLKDRIIMDIGASTGGFTDVCLRNGAKHVYAIDVGYGQLDWKLRNDPRVTVLERTNARYLKRQMFSEIPEIAVMDVSFISIRLILPTAFEVMGSNGIMYTLIKPQFEAGRDKIGKNGVVRNPDIHIDVIKGISRYAASVGLQMRRLDFSPITGPEGNIEFLAEIRLRCDNAPEVEENEIFRIVEEAHKYLARS